MMKANELRNMTTAEIKLKIEALKKELFNLRTEAKAGRIEKPHKINEVRKDIARCETVTTEKERSNSCEAPPKLASGRAKQKEKQNAK